MKPELTAPINKGRQYGTLEITLNGKPIISAPLVALSDDPEGGFWRRTADQITKFFKG